MSRSGISYHRLDDPDIEFICQQRVRRPSSHALTDLYFPQFRLHLEVDEPAHAANVRWDALRSRDIVDVTNHQITRIAAHVGGAEIGTAELARRTDTFVDLLRDLKRQSVASGGFVAWDYDHAYCAKPHLARGSIDASLNVVMRCQRDVLHCFGYQGGHYQRGIWRLDTDMRRVVWFPRLWQHGSWNNALSPDGRVITEDAGDQPIEGYRIPSNDDFVDERIVFAKWQDPLGRNVYRFTGVFRKCKERSTGRLTRFAKVSDRFDLRKLSTIR